MKKMNIRLFKPSLGNEELNSVKDSFNKSWIGLGPKVHEFEDKWSQHVNSKFSIGLNSATAALHLALNVFNFPKKKNSTTQLLLSPSTIEVRSIFRALRIGTMISMINFSPSANNRLSSEPFSSSFFVISSASNLGRNSFWITFPTAKAFS